MLRVSMVLCLVLVSGLADRREVRLGTVLVDTLRVRVSLAGEGRLAVSWIELFRSTTRLDPARLDTVRMPVSVSRLPGTGVHCELVDSMVAHNTTYYYRARVLFEDGASVWSTLDSVRTPHVELGPITGSSLLIDKINYFLAVRDGGRTRKRYPIALGSGPRRRKLHQDNATTPEGIYRIRAERPHSTFHKAFDIDYPNAVDDARYRLARERGLIARRNGVVPGQGGAIQIHGKGIDTNWTLGCVAMRDEDIDELFDHQRVGRGMPVIIVGTELRREDIRSIQDYRTPGEVREFQRRLKQLGFYDRSVDGRIGHGTRLALGRLQLDNDLPLTCDLDSRTVRILRQQ